MNATRISDVSLSSLFVSLNDRFAGLVRPTGTYRDAGGKLTIRMGFFKAWVTRYGETTEYTREIDGNQSVLTRFGFRWVFLHKNNLTIVDSDGTKLFRE